ncbi:conjugal transfer protein TraT [Pseudomonas sp. W2-17]|uniref:conjugal transfer protein TraT n=1 Tax=Pseudomonas sp. W2-17 TaxID=3058039 RepID=UPI0034E098CA
MQTDAIVMHDEDEDQDNPDADEGNPEEITAVLPIVELDISGDIDAPVPMPAAGERCEGCALHTTKLWQGARAGREEPHAVCTLCYLTGHLDSATAAHGRLAFLPGLSAADALHLQRHALLAILGGDKAQVKQGERVWKWMDRHSREVEVAWGSARAGEFAQAMKRLPPFKRSQLQAQLTGCVLMLPADMFDDLTLLLPSHKTVQSVLSTRSWATYTRSDLYV